NPSVAHRITSQVVGKSGPLLGQPGAGAEWLQNLLIHSTASMVTKLPKHECAALITREPCFLIESRAPHCSGKVLSRQLRTPLHTLAASMLLSGFSVRALSRRTSVVSG